MQRALWFRCLVVACFVSLPLAVRGQEEDDDEFPIYAPGLIATFSSGTQTAVRRDDDVAFRWGAARPDPRIPAGKFTARWQGRLFTIVTGEYRLHLYAAGHVRLQVNGQPLLDETRDEPGWMASKPVRFSYGHHPLQIEYTNAGQQGLVKDARIALFWEGPSFQLEPVPPRHLFHDPKQSPDERFKHGQLLVRALRCAACHSIAGQPKPLAAPSLKTTGGQVAREWIIDWLAKGHASLPADAKDQRAIPEFAQLTRRMPTPAVSREEAESIADFLIASAEPPGKVVRPKDPPPPAGKKKGKQKPPPPTAAAGETLFRTVGCLACHVLDGTGSGGLFGGGDLTAVAGKRPAEFFEAWLADPAAFNAAHRMPVFKLSSAERESLQKYLAGKVGTGKPARVTNEASQKSVERGRQLVKEHRCAACHELKGFEPPPAVSALTAAAKWDRACTAQPDPQRKRPGYALSEPARAAIQQYIAALPKNDATDPREDPAAAGPFVLAERNCLACHARELAPGIAAKLPQVVALDPKLADQLPVLAPPALNGIGDKFHAEALHKAILAETRLRPWLRIRMPRFNLDDAERDALVSWFVTHDRIPEVPHPDGPPELSATELAVAGRRLVTADGFGCTSCHQIGNSIPQKVALNARGTDLSMLGQRVRRPWFDRWTRNPARIVPRMEMPSIKLAVRGVMDDNVQHQLAAAWHVLNQPGFNPPLPNPVRVVRSSGLPESRERPHVLTDVLEVGDAKLIKPLLVGLPNRHNVLFDLESARLAGWWIGDTARQRTRGKTWYWEPGGSMVWPLEIGSNEWSLQSGSKSTPPQRIGTGQFNTELDTLVHRDGAIAFTHRLEFPQGTVEVTQTLAAVGSPQDKQSGFRRTVTATGIPEGALLRLQLLRLPGYKRQSEGELDRYTPAKGAAVLMRRVAGSFQDGVAQLSDKQPACTVEYLSPLPVDQYITPDVEGKPRSPVPLAVVPGFAGVELPIDEHLMPTGLAWREDGTLVVCSLKGRVWLARDTDGDGLEDQLTPFSDDLAAPYGVAVPPDAPKAIDIVNKYALLRLFDDDGDGHADRTVKLASGWGHTADYHDWAVGLERDKDGAYYVALPCEQDNRSPEAAVLRGKLLRIAPSRKRPGRPTQPGEKLDEWTVEEICGGLRFPMGLAINDAGDIFATDNQGNYNPFNELNHLRPGKRYGFINSNEKKQQLNPPLEEPAINIPHPWTRSVNGICFLRTPDALRKKLGRDLFADFEGHLVGCEYDTQRLIRMSLEKIGDTYQGAAYPFSIDPPKDQPGLQGPVVCQVAPDGDLYVGNMRDSGWGGGANVGSLVRFNPSGPLPAGIAEMRSTKDGFEVRFTQPIDPSKAALRDNYALEAYRRTSTPAYGGKDEDRGGVKVTSVTVVDPRTVRLVLGTFRPGFVYELRVRDISADGKGLQPDEAHFTLRAIR